MKIASRLRSAVLVVVLAALTACTATTPEPTPQPLPIPVCGGIKIAIVGALPCDRIVSIALATLAERAPDQLARGVTAIRVDLGGCPRGEMPPQIECGNEQFAQMVTVEFPPPAPGGPVEESLTVAVGPASGRVLGISNPLIR